MELLLFWCIPGIIIALASDRAYGICNNSTPAALVMGTLCGPAILLPVLAIWLYAFINSR